MRNLLLLLLLAAYSMQVSAQKIFLENAKFNPGDDAQWSSPHFNDDSWKSIKTSAYWEPQGYADLDGYAWYRFHIFLPSSLLRNSATKDSLNIYLSKIDDVNETFFNGKKIAVTGTFPDSRGQINSEFSMERNYHIALKDFDIHWDKDNVLAVRVYDGGGEGGMYGKKPFISVMNLIDGIMIDNSGDFSLKNDHMIKDIRLRNKYSQPISGVFNVAVFDNSTNHLISKKAYPVTITTKGNKKIQVSAKNQEGLHFNYTFTEHITGNTASESEDLTYILTPRPSLIPRLNGPQITGVRPRSPLLFKIAATGKRPLFYTADNLPEGLQLNDTTGIITGSVIQKGSYRVKLGVKNSLGKATRELMIKVGEQTALTPAMGWNSWNCWGLSINAQKVKSSAQAMIDKGLTDHGWNYVNIDDGWEAPERPADGIIGTNEKFPDVKELADWLHAKGFKFGIYSSPGKLTCGGFLGSYQHELQDAQRYNSWGVDYLKYDWCSYAEIAGKDTALATFIAPYQTMAQALRAQPRDIYYSLCQYGMKDVWKWGPAVTADSWRTTGDIIDTWQSLATIGFKQYPMASFAGPGHWNDPDMLIVGKVGWNGSLRNTHLTPAEQYTHISLWSLQASPLLIGCDISQMNDFTLNLLTNDEIIDVNQDTLGYQARRVMANAHVEVYIKKMSDGSKAIGIFNLTNHYQNVKIPLADLHLNNTLSVRDLWRQKDLGIVEKQFKGNIPPHGVIMLKAVTVNPKS